MKSSLKPLWVIFAFVLVLAVVSTLRQRWKPKEVVPWRTDFESAIAEAQKDRTPILLYFGAVWCGPCEEMKHTTFADPQVAQAMERVMPIKIDVDARPDLAREFGIWALPRFMMFHPERSVPKVVEGALSPAELMAWMGRPWPDPLNSPNSAAASRPATTHAVP